MSIGSSGLIKERRDAEESLKVEKPPPPSGGGEREEKSSDPSEKSENEVKSEKKRSPTSDGEPPNVKRQKPTYELTSFGQIQDNAFSVVSWNLDGLTEKDLCERTMYFIDMMKKRMPAVIMLQEVTDFSMKFLDRFLTKPYFMIKPPKSSEESGQRFPYYNCLLMSKYHWELDGAANCVFFDDSTMGRHIILQRAIGKNLSDGKHAFVFGTTHLESLKDARCVAERIKQSEQVFGMMETHLYSFCRGQPTCVIVGGDFNARQTEIAKAKKSYKEIEDVWEATGSIQTQQYTWDMMVNDNLRKGSGAPPMQVRTRFDRMYYRKNEHSPCKATEFKLIGKRRVGLESNMFVSDHWGMAATFDLTAG